MTAQRTIARRAVRQESEVLLRQLESYLTALRTSPREADLDRADRMAVALRQLIADTAQASAADRGRVRAAVHYFVSRDPGARAAGARYALLAGVRIERRPAVDGDRAVNDLLRELGREDLVID